MRVVADYETTTDPNDCRLWAYGLVDIDNPDNSFVHGNCIEDFLSWCMQNKNPEVYFHNLKFDGGFVLDYLLKNGYEHIKDSKNKKDKSFTTLISDAKVFYSIEIYFEVKNKRVKKVTILNSLNILPFKVSQIAKAFGLKESKGVIDYNKYRPKGYEMDSTEKQYLLDDCVIVAKALSILFSQGLEKMTQGSNALADFKSTLENEFRKIYPVLTYDDYLRQSYRGGYVFANPDFQGEDIDRGLVFDVNSLYPSVMYECMLPYGEGIYFKGMYKGDEVYNLYIINFTCQFELKKGYLPTLQLKKSRYFKDTEYCTTSNDDFINITMTSVDFELFKEHYNIYNLNVHDGWKFRSTNTIFKPYIDKWIAIKIQSELDGNTGMRTLAKLMLNALYGKFALNPRVTAKIPYLDTEKGIVKYYRGETEIRDPLYIPVGTFITSYAREKTIRSAQILMKPSEKYPKGRFLYADTDSLHVIGLDIPCELEVDATKLGWWKKELVFRQARYLRAKCYIELHIERQKKQPKKIAKVYYEKQEVIVKEINKINKLKVTVAGLPESCHEQVTWDNFHYGSVYTGKLKPEIVQGGIVLLPIDYTLSA
jgi:hypothetical protein